MDSNEQTLSSSELVSSTKAAQLSTAGKAQLSSELVKSTESAQLSTAGKTQSSTAEEAYLNPAGSRKSTFRGTSSE
jgi:hypothetical protein